MPVDSLVCDEYHFEHHGITVTQLGTFNQFDEAFWGPSISEFSTNNCICGYLTVAVCRILRTLLAGCHNHPLTMKEIRSVQNQLNSSKEEILLEVRRCMRAIEQKREQYIHNNEESFAFSSSELYLKALVASYELSDELRESVEVVGLFSSPWESESALTYLPVFFARENEYPQRFVATHEEKERITQEQSRFGGTTDANGVTIVNNEKGETEFILESIGDRKLLTPAEWESMEVSTSKPQVWAIHNQGHYLSGFTCKMETIEGPKTQVFTFNTMPYDNTNQPVMLTLLASLSQDAIKRPQKEG